MRFILNNATLVDASGEQLGSQITINGGKIISVDPARQIGENAVDAEGAIITPGFIDIHTHGGGGFSLHTGDPAEIRAYARWAPSTGTTSFLIGVVGVVGGLPEEQLEAAV